MKKLPLQGRTLALLAVIIPLLVLFMALLQIVGGDKLIIPFC
ncbi:hypothetical protein WGR15_24760 (plasmid) [Enterobacter asburiae]